jgi:hypothetical protein
MIDKLPAALRDAIKTEIMNGRRLEELGFAQDDFGQWVAENCRVTLYSSCGDWEIDIHLPNGSAVGCDTKAVSGRTADEIRTWRQQQERGER